MRLAGSMAHGEDPTGGETRVMFPSAIESENAPPNIFSSPALPFPQGR